MNQVIKQRSKGPTSQRGSTDHETVITVLVVITLLTIGYLILGWVKSVKDERVERNHEQYIEQFRRRPSKKDDRGPSGHQMVL